MKGIIKTSQDYFSYLRTVFVGKMLANVLIEENDVENELSKIKQNFNRIYSNERAKNFVRSSSLNQKFWKIVLTRWKKEDFPEPVNYDFDFENQKYQNKYIFMAEAIFVNPNSYNNIAVIMDLLKEALLIENENQWSLIGYDGPPYVITNRLID